MPPPNKAQPLLGFSPSDGVFLTILLLAFGAANYIWLTSDNRPPFWDMALHQSIGLQYHDYYIGKGLMEKQSWWEISGAYPPLYHHLLALLFFFGRSSDVAALGNLLPIALLVLGTFLLGRFYFSPATGLLASLILVCFPYMAWISRETIIDLTMAAVVLWTILALESTRGWTHRGPSLRCGFMLGLCALTKWIAPLFLIFPLLYSMRKKAAAAHGQDGVLLSPAEPVGEVLRPHLTPRGKNLLDACLVAMAVALGWYAPKLQVIVDFLQGNVAVGAAEGEPTVISWDSLIYYLRLLEGQQIHALFFFCVLIGFFYAFRRQRSAWIALTLWIASGYLGLTLLRTKDPRFSLPLLPAMALFCTCWMEGIRRPWARVTSGALLGLFAVGTFYMVSFGWSALPREMILMKGYQGSYSWDWKWYSQDYLGMLGPPRQEAWPHQEILLHILKSAPRKGPLQLGIVPDFPRLNQVNLKLVTLQNRWPIAVHRIGSLSGGSDKRLSEMDFLLVAEGEQQGMGWSTKDTSAVNQYIFSRPQQFVVDTFYNLPDGIHIRLYRVQQ